MRIRSYLLYIELEVGKSAALQHSRRQHPLFWFCSGFCPCRSCFSSSAFYSHAPSRSSIFRPHMLHSKTIMHRCWWKIQTTRLSEICSLFASAGIARRNQYTYTNTYMYKHMHAHAHMHTHTHMHTCTRAHTHMHTLQSHNKKYVGDDWSVPIYIYIYMKALSITAHTPH